MRFPRMLGAILAALALGACGGDDEAESANYSGATSTDEISEDAGDAEAESDASEAVPTPIDPVSFRVLLAYLPAAPEGWTASEPQGSTTAVPGYKVSTASNQYQAPPASEGGPVQRVSLTITDGGYAEAIAAPFQMAAMMSSESTDGYQKGVTLEGQPGFETWQIQSRHSELQLLVGNRFLVNLSGDQLEPEVLREWASRIGLEKLAAEK
jgi:hypothetical protein